MSFSLLFSFNPKNSHPTVRYRKRTVAKIGFIFANSTGHGFPRFITCTRWRSIESLQKSFHSDSIRGRCKGQCKDVCEITIVNFLKSWHYGISECISENDTTCWSFLRARNVFDADCYWVFHSKPYRLPSRNFVSKATVACNCLKRFFFKSNCFKF